MRWSSNRKAGRARATGSRKLQLRQLDSVRAWAFLARLDLKADPLATGQRVEVHRRIEPGPVKEILPTVLGRNEPETAVGDQLLDGACRHLPTPFSKHVANARGLS